MNPPQVYIFLIHSSADGHLGYFHVLAIVNSAAVNIGEYIYTSFSYDNHKFLTLYKSSNSRVVAILPSCALL